MRRILVIFLILLFPLNVFALSLSVSTAQQGGATEHATTVLSADAGADADADAEARGDVDPDEPPSVADLHDLVNQERALHLAGPCAGAAPPLHTARDGLSLPPPVKPPRLA